MDPPKLLLGVRTAVALRAVPTVPETVWVAGSRAGASGVAAALALLTLLPAPLVATTVKLYDVPLRRGATLQLVLDVVHPPAVPVTI